MTGGVGAGSGTLTGEGVGGGGGFPPVGDGIGLLLLLLQTHAPQTVGYSSSPTILQASLSVRPKFEITQLIRDPHEYPSASLSNTCGVHESQPHLLLLISSTGEEVRRIVGGIVGLTGVAVIATTGAFVGGRVDDIVGPGVVLVIGAFEGEGTGTGTGTGISSSDEGRHCEKYWLWTVHSSPPQHPFILFVQLDQRARQPVRSPSSKKRKLSPPQVSHLFLDDPHQETSHCLKFIEQQPSAAGAACTKLQKRTANSRVLLVLEEEKESTMMIVFLV
mmetsp:Transcript_52288/g.56715  ORF Transcript_52288/g.56715 Transcript_52288/m.56715 type:complete len:276 (-) Transcript_52288:127-954(-)